MSMKTDVAIIGAGTAGMVAYRAALDHTPNVLLIDPGPYGTTCARVGCMPSKLLIAAADAAHHVREAEGFGIVAHINRIDGVAVMDRVRRERDRFVAGVVSAIERWPETHRLPHRARFVDANTLRLDDGRSLHAERIVIATGSRPRIPEGWREALGDRLWVNDEVFDWTDLPESVAVVGAGVIGLELGQALHRLGVRVRVFGRGTTPGGLTDPKVAEHAARVLAESMPLALGSRIDEVAREGEGVRVAWHDAEGIQRVERFAGLIAAVGRVPNVDAMGLEDTGLALDDRGVPIHDPHTGRVGDSTVFIAGDAAARRMILHEAAEDGHIAGDNAGRYPDVRAHPRRAALGVVFSDPQMMIAGRSHAELTSAGVDFLCAELDFADQGRSRVMRRNQGMIRVYGERGSDLFLGAEMVGPSAEHLGHLLAWAVQAKRTVQQLIDSPFYHPVVEEGLRTALRLLQRDLGMGPEPDCVDCGPGV